MNQETLKVAFIEQSPIRRAGMKAILSNQSRLDLAFESHSVEECLELLKSSPADVVIIGLRSLATRELDQLTALQEIHPQVTTILHVREGDDVVCPKALSAKPVELEGGSVAHFDVGQGWPCTISDIALHSFQEKLKIEHLSNSFLLSKELITFV